MLKNSTNWIQNYLEYASFNEAPEHFHYWTALGILGAALKRNVYIRSFGTSKIFPALFTLIVAPSGTGKSVAINLGHNILSKVDGINVLPEKSTPEVIMRRLFVKDELGEVQSQGIVFAEELSVFLDKKKHNQNLVPFLLAITGHPDKWEYATVSGGSIVLERVALSLLAGTAPDLLVDSIPMTALKSGFMARIVTIPILEGVVKRVSPLTVASEQDKVLEKMYVKESVVINGLEQLMSLRGIMKVLPDAFKWYNAWYHNYNQIAGTLATDIEKFAAYVNRRPVHLLRVAQLINIGRGRGLSITKDSMVEAHKRLSQLETGLPRIYEDIEEIITPGRLSVKQANNIVLAPLAKSPRGYMFHTPLTRAVGNRMKLKEVKETLSELEEKGLLLKKMSKTGAKVYILASHWEELKQDFKAGKIVK